MSTRRAFLIGVAGLGLGFLIGVLSLGAGGIGGKTSSDAGAEDHQTVVIAPGDFAVLPCPRIGDRGLCVVIAAGGKRVLVGAPAGIGASARSVARPLGSEGVPDAILLFSLDAAQIEGIDEIRSHVWEAGLSQLPLVGGDGIEEINAGLDQTYIVPDAVAYVRRTRRKAFDKPPLAVRPVRHGDIAFSTGDLIILALSGGTGKLAFHVAYGGQSVILADCSPRPSDVASWPQTDYYLGCVEAAGAYAPIAVGNWPLTHPVFIKRGNRDG